MAWELTDSVEHFEATAGDFLRSRPVQHTVLLTLVDTLRRHGLQAYGEGSPVFGFWRTDGVVDGVLLQTPPRPMIFSEIPAEAVVPAVRAVAHLPLPGVNLLADAAEEFAGAWRERTGSGTSVSRRTRLYRLGALTSPVEPPPGRARVAGAGDRPLVTEWIGAMFDEIREEGDAAAITDDRLSYGGVTLWEDDGSPVSLAARSRHHAGMIRVQTVYTPPALRGRGYAAGATTAVTREALALGARDVVLNTDLTNPTSNRLYMRLGYRPVEDRTVVEFS
nr:GNAT family N-acetyltransferase [uncultured Actinoplanes sp.]